MTQTVFWTIQSIDWGLLRDDHESAEFIAPWVMWRTPEEAKQYVLETINTDVLEERKCGFDEDNNLLPEVAERGHTKEQLWEDTLESIEWVEHPPSNSHWTFMRNEIEWTVYPITLKGDDS